MHVFYLWMHWHSLGLWNFSELWLYLVYLWLLPQTLKKPGLATGAAIGRIARGKALERYTWNFYDQGVYSQWCFFNYYTLPSKTYLVGQSTVVIGSRFLKLESVLLGGAPKGSQHLFFHRQLELLCFGQLCQSFPAFWQILQRLPEILTKQPDEL